MLLWIDEQVMYKDINMILNVTVLIRGCIQKELMTCCLGRSVKIQYNNNQYLMT